MTQDEAKINTLAFCSLVADHTEDNGDTQSQVSGSDDETQNTATNSSHYSPASAKKLKNKSQSPRYEEPEARSSKKTRDESVDKDRSLCV